MRISLVASAVASALAAVSPAWAQQVKPVERITVTASPLGREEAEMAQPATVLSEDELRRKRAASLGDTLSQELGVQSSAFGAAAGRPIIRGLDGPRIRVLENGVGTGDISGVSPDHAVASESLRAQQIEILRGPASLLYGSGAIGGIVNVVSGTIPRGAIAGLAVEAEARLASANRERTASVDLDGGSGAVAWHLDGFRRRTGDYETPLGRLANSDVDMRGGGGGASLVGARGFAGIGAQRLEKEYGVPSGEGVRIRMRQDRCEAAAEALHPIAGFTSFKARAVRSDYRHDEIESTGELGTTFRNRGSEGRLELRHGGVLSGTLGVQGQRQELSAIGAEAILPPTQSRALAAFIVEEKDLGAWVVDAGLRVERERRRPRGDLGPRSFSLVTPAVGLVLKPSEAYRVALSATSAQRAPSVEELYVLGPHPATATFEIGNADLRKEVSRNVDLTVRKVRGSLRWKMNAYVNRVKDYVFGASEDTDGDGVADRANEEGELDARGEFLVLRRTQAAALIHGFEGEVGYRPTGGNYGLRLFGDVTRGRLRDGTGLPRIAPARLGLNAEVAMGPWGGSLTAIRAFRQKHTAPLESQTPAHARIDVELTRRLDVGAGRKLTLFLQGTNLLDEEIRIHASFLKNVAPQMGRSLTLGLRAEL